MRSVNSPVSYARTHSRKKLMSRLCRRSRSFSSAPPHRAAALVHLRRSSGHLQVRISVRVPFLPFAGTAMAFLAGGTPSGLVLGCSSVVGTADHYCSVMINQIAVLSADYCVDPVLITLLSHCRVGPNTEIRVY